MQTLGTADDIREGVECVTRQSTRAEGRVLPRRLGVCRRHSGIGQRTSTSCRHRSQQPSLAWPVRHCWPTCSRVRRWSILVRGAGWTWWCWRGKSDPAGAQSGSTSPRTWSIGRVRTLPRWTCGRLSSGRPRPKIRGFRLPALIGWLSTASSISRPGQERGPWRSGADPRADGSTPARRNHPPLAAPTACPQVTR